MNEFLASSAAGYVAIALIAVGGALTIFLAIVLPDSPFRDVYERYVTTLDGYVRFLLLKTTGAYIARVQAIVIGVLLVLLAASGNPLVIAILAVAAAAPLAVLDRRKTERIEQLEQQLDGWLMMLANAIKATPAIGEALKSTASLVQAPMAEELDLIVKEVQLGTPVDQAVLNASNRIESTMVSGALATLVIARQTGGDLPKILETNASSLREMTRLEGVVKSKTAEGKGQVVVLAVVPFFMVGLLGWIDPSWLAPLTSNFAGYMVVAIAVGLWALAIIWARSILDVDL